ncbi:tripeptide aminopeptidase [Flavobacteriaceae bacterium UJ101]|nr:tripeptide aminopeptidase [Flavobacteriaceae bacterium UJ101]
MKQTITDRFLKYVSIYTESKPFVEKIPSTERQFDLARYLEEELTQIGLSDITVDEHAYVMATLPSNIDEEVPTIGFVAHMDTSPDFTAKNTKPQIWENYDGNDLVLNEDLNIILKTDEFPEIKQYKGQTIITTDGTTLLGADDKAGIAEIVTAMEYLINHPEIKHGKIRICFTPDEEVGRGAELFDVKKFDAQWAYTLDGSEIGELEYENFNAAYAKITIKGKMVHPGSAKDKMINSGTLARRFADMLPFDEVPEHTEGYEGFFHLMRLNATVEESTLEYIIRDHDREQFEARKNLMQEIGSQLNQELGKDLIHVDIKDQYYNMREKVEPVMHIVDIAEEAIKMAGVTPNIKAIRGGTDGSQLSFKGLPCPNIFAGGHNFHGRFEYVPVESMMKATEVIVNIAQLVSSKK